MPGLLLRKMNPTFFLRYLGVFIAALWTGMTSTLADPDAGAPPILASLYGVIPIQVWGWAYLIVGSVLAVGLFGERTARAGLALVFALLSIRFGFQIWQVFAIWQDGAPWREVLSTGSGLGILLGFVLCVFSMVMESFTTIDPTDPDTVVFLTNGNEEGNS